MEGFKNTTKVKYFKEGGFVTKKEFTKFEKKEDKVEAKKDRISKLKNKFAPETTCSYTKTGVNYNLHVQSVQNLLNILSWLITDKNSFMLYTPKSCGISSGIVASLRIFFCGDIVDNTLPFLNKRP